MKKILIVDGSLAKAHVNSYTRSDGTFVQEHDNGRQAAAPKPAAGDKASIPHGHAGAYFPAHRQRIAEMKHGDSIKIKAGEDEHTLTRDGDNVHIARKKAAPAKKVVVRKEAAAGGDKKPSTWQEAQEHAFKAGAKFKSNVAVFNTAENAHSRASRSAGSKGGAFVMKHPDHNFHVVVNGADSQRMEKNGYQHVSPSGR